MYFLHVRAAIKQLQQLQAQVYVDHLAAGRARAICDAKGAEAHSCQELLKADGGILDDNRGITAGLR